MVPKMAAVPPIGKILGSNIEVILYPNEPISRYLARKFWPLSGNGHSHPVGNVAQQQIVPLTLSIS
jgi:hypothetical protein